MDYKKINERFDNLIQNTNGEGEKNRNEILDKLNFDVMSAIEDKFDGSVDFSMNIEIHVRGEDIKFSIDDRDEVLICGYDDGLSYLCITKSIVSSIDRIDSLVCASIHIKTNKTHFSELL